MKKSLLLAAVFVLVVLWVLVLLSNGEKLTASVVRTSSAVDQIYSPLFPKSADGSFLIRQNQRGDDDFVVWPNTCANGVRFHFRSDVSDLRVGASVYVYEVGKRNAQYKFQRVVNFGDDEDRGEYPTQILHLPAHVRYNDEDIDLEYRVVNRKNGYAVLYNVECY